MAGNKQFEAVSYFIFTNFPFCERRNLDRMVGDEDRLNERLFDAFLEEFGDDLARGPPFFDVNAVLVCHRGSFFTCHGKANVLARDLIHELDHARTSPFTTKMDGRALILHIERTASRHSCCLHEALRELHHALKIGESFHRGELGVVIRIHAFVAELAADLKNLLEAAYEQALQRKLGCDAQKVIAIERVEMRGEGLRVRAAHDRMQEGRFDLVETLLFHVVADSRDDL